MAPAKPSHKGPGYDAPVAKGLSLSLVLLAALDRPRRSRGAHVPRRIFESLAELTSSLTEAPEEQLRRRLDGRLQEINGLEARFAELSASLLTAEARALRARAARETLEALLPEAFALVREASKRTLRLRHFDVQILGGIALHEGQIAEMATGEGKTLVAILPAFLNALTGDGVHVVTTNDYLARRDAAWVGRVLRFLGLTVGVVQAEMSSAQKREAYRCDVTYVTNQQLGFDYLRDQMANLPSDLRLRQHTPFHCAIVDEADSVLIDEGRTPLVVSAQQEVPSTKYSTALALASDLVPSTDYTVLEKEKTCTLTELGEEKISQILGIRDLYDPQDPWAPYVVNALTAKELYVRERQYLVREAQVVVVDEFTGRPVEGRNWSDGLQQAIEAKEGVPISKEAIVLASISYQCLFRLYQKLAGMTGTAWTEKDEFESIYDLKVSPIPSNKPCQRRDEDDEVYTSEEGKWSAVVRAVREAHSLQRPVLVGTTSIENSERLARHLEAEGVPYYLLNAKPENASREAEIIAAGGRLGAVTISTNMAGRGTDIVLGGDAKSMAKLHLQAALVEAFGRKEEVSLALCLDLPEEIEEEMSQAASAVVHSNPSAQLEAVMAAVCDGIEDPQALTVVAYRDSLHALQTVYSKACQQLGLSCSDESLRVAQLGGLQVLGTERHESQRTDRQLRGRAGRQGDPGSSRFCLSLADKVFRVFGGDSIRTLTADMGGADGVPIVSPLLSAALDEAQSQVQSFFFGIRKDVFEYDQVLDQQRQVIYALRRKALLDSDAEVLRSLQKFCEESMSELVQQLCGEAGRPGPVASWPLKRLATKLSAWFTGSWSVTLEELQHWEGDSAAEKMEEMTRWIQQGALDAMKRKASRIDEDAPELSSAVYRQVLLMQIDNYWRRHLKFMTNLRNYSKLRSYGQRDPLVEYKLEAYKTFQVMIGKIRRDTIYYLFTFQPRPLRPVETEAGLGEGEGELVQVPSNLDEKVRSYLRGLPRPLAKVSDIAKLLEPDGLRSDDQLTWLGSCDGVSVLEDSFARARYVSLDAGV